MQLKFVTVIAVLLLVVAICGCDGNNRNTGQTQVASYTPSGTNAPAGATTVSVTATSLGSSNSLSSSYGSATIPATGNKFVTYAIYLQNINAKDMSMGNPYYFRLRDTNGNLYSFDSYTFSLQQQVNGVTLKGLSVETHTQTGDKYSGLIAFQIPTSATPKTLTYDDYTNKITINL